MVFGRLYPGFLPGIFSGEKSLLLQISFVILIFQLLSDQILGGGKLFEGVPLAPAEESQYWYFKEVYKVNQA